MSDPDKLHAGDRALFTGPYMELTPKILGELEAGIRAHERRYQEDFPKLLEECPYETRLAVACFVMRHVYAHAKEGGSYRYLIYERLGFGPDSYAPLMFADALNISNEFVVTEPSEEDGKLAQAIAQAYEPLPIGPHRTALVEARLRFEALAASVRAASTIIERQRRELEAAAGKIPKPEVPPQ